MTKNSSTGKGRLSCEQADAIKRDLQVVCRCFQSQFHNDVQQQDGDEEMIEISENISYFKRQEQRSISAYLSQLFLSHHRLLAEMLTCSMKCSLSWFLDSHRWVAGSRDQIQIGKIPYCLQLQIALIFLPKFSDVFVGSLNLAPCSSGH